MFEGYLSFAGVEIANAARTQAYLENILPRFGFESCWDAKDLPCILGDAPYRTPPLDPAPWFSESRPASSKFLGFYPLSVVGVEDSSREVTVTELVQDGAVFSLPRKASKQFRVQGILVAEDGEGIDVGMSWLRGALDGSDCRDGDCAGDTFCYLAYLPACCNYNDTSEFPSTPVDWTWQPGSSGPWVSYANGSIASLDDGVRIEMPCPGDGVQLYMAGLIPGQTYRVTVEVASASALRLELGGGEGVTAKRANEHFPDVRNPWVGDFIASGDMQTLRVLSAEPECGADSARIYSVKVERTAELLSKFLPRFNSGSFTEPVSWLRIMGTGTTASLPVPTLPEPDAIEKLSLRWTNTTGSTKSIGADAGGRRIMRGLTGGQEYLVYIKARMTTGVGLRFQVSSLDSDGVTIIEIPVEVTDLGSEWFSVEFTAAQPQHYLDILTDASSAILNNTTEAIEVEYIRVDANAQTLYIAPVDQSLPALRTLHNVTLLDGPNVVEQFPKEHGAMTSVEFTMAVGEPAIYGQLVDVQPTIEATTFLVGNTACSEGTPVRYNAFSNPRLTDEEVGELPMLGIHQHTVVIASQADVEVAAPIISDPVEATDIPSNSALITPTGTNDSYMRVNIDPPGGMLIGHTYTISATLTLPGIQTGTLHANARRIVLDGDNGAFYSPAGINYAGSQRVSLTFTYLGGAIFALFYNGAASGGGDVYWSEFLFEESGFPGSPFDGDGTETESGPEYTWTGTPYESTSRFAEDAAQVITDPDCPPVPVAPQPPGIIPDCPREVEEWRRYWMAIPPELAGGWRESVPVVKLSTSENVVRDVRVRFYANPLNESLNEIDECGACGEFYISYIPKATVMTIDGIRERVTANVSGTGEANAMHLASDADYGPVRWPTMTCDIPYYMTVDIAPDEVLDLDIRLAVAQRE